MDRNNKNSPLESQKEVVVKLFREIRNKISGELMTFEDVVRLLNSASKDDFNEIDAKISVILESSSYLYMFHDEYANCPDSYDVDLCLLNKADNNSRHFDDQISGAETQLRIHKNNMRIYTQFCKPSKYRYLMMILYSNLIKQDSKRMATYKTAKSKIFGLDSN